MGLAKFIEIPEIVDDCYLYFAENPTQIHFPVKRIYFITRAKKDLPRGFHAHKKTDQVLFCIQGKIKMVIDDGNKKEEVILDSPSKGIALPRMLWHEMHDFEENTILLVLASMKFDPKDYIRDYDEFLKASNK